MVHIDGSYGEGGGQVLRSALTLATITGQDVRLTNIRAGRPNPGLAPQHLTVLRALAHISEADVLGDALGSQEITYAPTASTRAGRYTFDVEELTRGGSAGSVTLIFQALLLPLVNSTASSRLTLRGGTHVAWSPPYDAIQESYLPTLEQMGLHADCSLDAWGFYPKGGGQMSVKIQAPDSNGGLSLSPLNLHARGDLLSVRGRSVACNLPAHIAQRMGDRARSILRKADLPTDIQPVRVKGRGPGAGIFLIAEYEHTLAAFSALGRPGKPSEKVAEEVCDHVLAFHRSRAAVDEYLADQLILPMALAEGPSTMTAARITDHLRTNAHVIQKFLPVCIETEVFDDGLGEVRVHGSGL